MRRLRLAGYVLGGLLIGYPLLLVILGYALSGVVEDRVRDRVAYALRAEKVEIESVDVSLLRGQVSVRGVRAQRTSIGTATLEIGTLEIELAPMGLLVFNSDPDEVLIKDANLELSAVGAATLRKGKSSPLAIGRLEVVDSGVELVATSLLPSIGRAELRVRKAVAHDIELSNAMSWLYHTERLEASVRATGDVEFGLRYGDGQVAVSGSFLGSEPVEVPFQWPAVDASLPEISQLLIVAKSLVKKLAPEFAKRKASGMWGDIVEFFE